MLSGRKSPVSNTNLAGFVGVETAGLLDEDDDELSAFLGTKFPKVRSISPTSQFLGGC
jgi:hypothetical protein